MRGSTETIPKTKETSDPPAEPLVLVGVSFSSHQRIKSRMIKK